MRADFLRIAGVKSEVEFYKKFPSEEAFMKKHGKAIKKLKAKKAKVGTMIPNMQTPQSNITPIRFGEEEMYDASAKLMGRKSTKELKDDAMYDAQMTSYQPKEEKKPGFMDQFMGLADQFGKMPTGNVTTGDLSEPQFPPIENRNGGKTKKGYHEMPDGTLMKNTEMKQGGKVKKFTPHMMYHPKTGKGKKVKTLKEHLALRKKNWGHKLKKAVEGAEMNKFGEIMNSDAVQNWGVPIVSDAFKIADQIEAQKDALGNAKKDRQLSEVALQASKTTAEKVDRSYVRPEDFTNTGEEFFPVYGVGTNVLAKHGGNYKAQDGGMFNGEYTPLVDPNQQKQFNQGGTLGSNSYLVPKANSGFTSFNAGSASYGGGAYGAAGQKAASMVGVNDDAGSAIGGTIGSTIGSAFGPAGAAVGGFLGSAAGDLLDRNDRRQGIEKDATARNTKEMSYGAIAPSIQAGYSSHVKNGGKVPSYRSGGNMRGDYVSPNPSALDTMKMGGNLKTLWGGEAETVSYNPYAGGESIQFKGNSHDYRDPKTGQTGIGVAYGDDAKQMSMGGDITSNASVEVENEPAQEIDDSLVVYGDMKIPEDYISEIGDDRAKGKKFKSYISNVLNKDEAKINKRQTKVAELGLESDDTTFGQLERNTADVVLKGADMKLKSIAEKKSILATLQEAMNETFDEYGIKANEFINKGKLVEDPMRIENAKYGARLKMGEDGVETTGNQTTNPPSEADYNKKQISKTDKTKEQLEEEGYEVDPSNTNIYIKRNPTTNTTDAVEMSGSSLGFTPEGQGIDPDTGYAGGVTQEDYNLLKENNSWFDWSNVDPKKTVTYKGKKVSTAILKFQKEFNKRVKGTDIANVKEDGIFGQETKDAIFTPAKEAAEETTYDEEKVMLDPKATAETTPLDPVKNQPPMVNFNNAPEDVPLDGNQLLAERYAMATNQVQPVQAQGFQPQLRVPYDVSLQDAKNDIISQSRTLERNPALRNNPAALAMMQAPAYEALNKINAEEFRMNQQMKDNVYSGNRDVLNQANMTNLGIYDTQANRQAQAAANTRTQNIDILSSISDKYSQNKRDNALNKVYANMYPTFKFDKDGRANVVNSTQFNTGQSSTGTSPLSLLQGITGGGSTANNIGDAYRLLQFGNEEYKKYNQKKTAKEEADKLEAEKKAKELEEEVEKGKYGKKVTKNNKNSNILRAIRNL